MANQDPPSSLFSQGERIDRINVADEIKNSFLDYSMSVIISRALPDVRDGLKPSQRRVLLAMHDLNLYPGRQHRKCAKICGDTSGNYHPHGEAVIYPTLVHMAQHWAMRDTLIDGQGNFGSVEGDPPAAMRYTEARLTHLGALLMEDMDKDTVNFVPNYDETREEPVVFPAAFPNLLVNGGTGIAVGMATNIPPHNLGEIVDGICAQIDDPEITIKALMKHIKGPDFPTGCTVLGLEGVRNYFNGGKGSIKVRGRMHTEEHKGGKEVIVITEIPFNVNRAELVKRIAELTNDKVLAEVSDVRDESDENTRVVVELKRDAVTKVVINKLYQHTALESSFSANVLAIDGGRPKTLNLKELINCYIEHRREVILRRTRFELNKAEARAETLEGYLIALANLDDFIDIIRKSRNRDEARLKLLGYEFPRKVVEKFGITIRNESRLQSGRYIISEQQVDSILELRLYQLTGMEREKIQGEYKELLERIEDLMDILAKESRVLSIIKEELRRVKEKYATKRRTDFAADEGDMAIEDLIANEAVLITMTHNGLIKRTNVSSYRAQKRGGKGVIGMTMRESEKPEESDFIEHLFSASTHDYLMFFTNLGRAYVERVHSIPDMGRNAKGKSIANVLSLKTGETVAALIRIPSKRDGKGEDITWESEEFLFFATQQGTVKKTALKDFANTRAGGIIAIGIEQGDLLIDVKLTDGKQEPVLITAEGMSIRFEESDVRCMGRPAGGVRGISLDKGDKVVGIAMAQNDATLLVAGENGIGKRTGFDEYRTQSRGGKGIITMKTGDKTGRVVGVLTVRDSDEMMLTTLKGQMVRISVAGVRECGRNTQGVKLVTLDSGDKLTSIAPVVSVDQEDEIEGEV
ncbi:MAG: DNA gyrase subunit A [Candidatus Methylacidiphilales bacterium]|nr:DNA gyrase subunit A [Candidatus Methylacidiphilales bacterium]